MSVTIHIPTPLRQFVGNADSLSIEGRTVGEALQRLTSLYPDLRKHLYTDEGKLRSFINVYVNDEDVRYLERSKTPLKESDEVRIIPSIAGGSTAVAPGTELSQKEILRYSRHLIMPEVGMEGQLKLKAGKVLTIGAGGLGSPLALYLAAAGVGKIGIVDFDVVDASNLQRQLLHGHDDIGRPKVESAAETLRDLNPDVEVVAINEHLNSETAMRIFSPYDVIVDGTDNFPTRYLANDAAHFLAK